MQRIFFLFHLLFLFFLAFVVQRGAAKLLQVQVLHRHGARSHLRKDAAAPGNEGGASLLAEGYNQAKVLGKIIRDQYLGMEGFRETYRSAEDVRAVSSNFERTVGTSRGFLEGLYPGEGRIPTLMFANASEDYLLRAYGICGRFEEKLQEFYASEAFRQKEKDSRALRERYAKPLGESAELENWFNVYDRILLKHRGYNDAGVGDIKVDFESDLKKIEELAAWVELRKFGIDVAENLVGGAVLAEMISRADNFGRGDKSTTHRITEYSAHYPTLLGFLAAMRVQPKTSLIPDFTSALIWELHEEGNIRSIRMIFYEGKGENGKFIPFGFPGCSDAVEKCPLSTIKSSTSQWALTTSEFCQACSTSSRQPAICRSLLTCSSSGRVFAGITGGLIGLVLGVAVVLSIVLWKSHKQRQVMAQQATALQTDMQTEELFGKERARPGVV